jgi:DNA modification methylase
MKQIKNRVIELRHINWKKLEWLKPEDYKISSEENLTKLENSLTTNHFIDPFKIWFDEKESKMFILDGHRKQLALTNIETRGSKIPERLPAVFIECKNIKDAAKLVLAYDSIYGKVNNEGLKDYLSLFEIDYSEIAEFTNIPELDASYLNTAEFDEKELDEIPEVPKKAQSKTGDLFLIDGRHRILCGDSTDPDQVSRLMDGKKAEIFFTDPPYNVDYGSSLKDKKGSKRGGKKPGRKILNDNFKSSLEFKEFLKRAILAAKPFIKGDVYIFMSSSELHTLQSAFAECDGHWSTFIIWIKNHFTMGRSNYQRQYEPILYGWFNKTSHYWSGVRNLGDIYYDEIQKDEEGNPLIRMESGSVESNIWEYPRPQKSEDHPTMKPVKLLARGIENSTKPNGIVLDTFSGSGSTIIAAEFTTRTGYGIEMDPIYIDLILKRYKKLYPKSKFECVNRKFDFKKLFIDQH